MDYSTHRIYHKAMMKRSFATCTFATCTDPPSQKSKVIGHSQVFISAAILYVTHTHAHTHVHTHTYLIVEVFHKCGGSFLFFLVRPKAL